MVSLGRGLGSGSGGWWGGGLPVEMREKGKRGGEGGWWVGTDKGTGKSMRTRLSKPPFHKLPFFLPGIRPT